MNRLIHRASALLLSLSNNEARLGSEKGIALIAVLWLLILLSLVAAVVSLETHSGTRLSRNMAESAAARAAADAGIQRAVLDLITFSGKFRGDGSRYNWQFANFTVHISIQYEVGKVNLNRAPEALLTALFISAGVDRKTAQSLSDAVADFRDADNTPRVQGAEKAEYRAAGLTWNPKNVAFESVEELLQVLGMTPEIYERVAPYLTIYTTGGVVTPAVASAPLAQLLSKGGFESGPPAQGIGIFDPGRGRRI